jgi:PAS domain S-box-containing protein
LHGRHWRGPVAALVAGLVAAVGLAFWANVGVDRQRSNAFNTAARQISDNLVARIGAYADVLYGLRSLVSARPGLGRTEFHDYVTLAGVQDRYPGVRALEWAPSVPTAHRGAFETSVRADASLAAAGAPPFTIHPPAQGAMAVVVDYVEPLAGNMSALGLDLTSNAQRSQGLTNARDTGDLVATAPVRLVQQPDRPGFLLFLAVYDTPGVPLTAPARRRHFHGVVLEVFTVDDLLSGVIGQRQGLSLEAYDVGRTIDPSPVAVTRDESIFGASLQALRPASAPRLRRFEDIDVGGRRWRLFLTADRTFAPAPRPSVAALVLAVGIALSVLGAMLAASVGRTRRRRTQEVFHSFLSTSPDAVLIVDSAGTIVEANGHAESVFGYGGGGLSGYPVQALLPPPYDDGGVPGATENANDADSGPVAAGLGVPAVRHDGSAFAVDVSVSPLPSVRDAQLYVAAVRDVTEREWAQQALELALDRERTAAEQLRQADLMKDEFLDVAAHELRTPLTAISGFAHLLRERDGLDEEVRGDLQARIAMNAEAMAEMVDRLLDMSQLQTGKVSLSSRSLSVREEIRRCLDALGVALRDHQVVVDVAPGLEMSTDPAAFAHVFGNLLTNAAKFSRAGTTITVIARASGPDVELSVTDQGAGIPVDAQPHVFERFFQAPNQVAGKRGAGVGLSIVERYVTLMGGRVWLESVPGSGSTFSFTVPRPASASPKPEPGRGPTVVAP